MDINNGLFPNESYIVLTSTIYLMKALSTRDNAIKIYDPRPNYIYEMRKLIKTLYLLEIQPCQHLSRAKAIANFIFHYLVLIKVQLLFTSFETQDYTKPKNTKIVFWFWIFMTDNVDKKNLSSQSKHSLYIFSLNARHNKIPRERNDMLIFLQQNCDFQFCGYSTISEKQYIIYVANTYILF